jgi:hypothetical protein
MQTMYAIHLGSYESFAQNSFLELFWTTRKELDPNWFVSFILEYT